MARETAYWSGTLKAPFGRIVVVASDRGVHNVMFDPDDLPRSLEGCTVIEKPSHPVVAETLRQLREYFAGTRTSFDVKLDLDGTEFQIAAWKALAKVKFGRTASYAQQATSIGRPTATRAVGAANGKNPVAIILPCHRIVGANGSLTGFAGGLDTKKWLLDHEQKVLAKGRKS
jgi:methylated-DNA-[protein]-cysteine S-methyltransferase